MSAAVLPCAVSSLSASLVGGPSRACRVLGVSPSAVYLAVPGGDPAMLPLLTTDALQIPTGLRVAASASEHQWRIEPGAVGQVGAGRVTVGGVELRAAREWRPERLTPGADSEFPERVRTWLSARAAEQPALTDRASRLCRAALEDDSDQVRSVVLSLVGDGPGLTPSGDDVLCGVLLAVRTHTSATDARERVWVALETALDRTTDISTALLRLAHAGYGVPQLLALVRSVTAGDVDDAERDLPAVLAIGHSSGRDLVAGLVGAVSALALRSA